jgi:glucose-1-phosphate thymidylyltransferase
MKADPDQPTRLLSSGDEVVALIPAAGSGSRLAPIPGSKEVFPVGFSPGADGTPEVRVISQYLFERMASAGVGRGIVVLRQGKWDIPAFYGQGEPAGMQLAYVVVGETQGPPDTIDHAYAFVHNAAVVFGFPDMLLGPADVYDQLLNRLDADGVDAVLGLYEVEDRGNSDMVQLDADGFITDIALKDKTSTARYCWGSAAWKPAFTRFLRSFVADARSADKGDRYAGLDASGDLPTGLAFKAAVEAGLRVAGVPFPGESWTDIGNRQTLARVSAGLRSTA